MVAMAVATARLPLSGDTGQGGVTCGSPGPEPSRETARFLGVLRRSLGDFPVRERIDRPTGRPRHHPDVRAARSLVLPGAEAAVLRGGTGSRWVVEARPPNAWSFA